MKISQTRSEPVQYPRRLAAQVLSRVLSDHEHLDEVLASLSGSTAHGGQDQDIAGVGQDNFKEGRASNRNSGHAGKNPKASQKAGFGIAAGQTLSPQQMAWLQEVTAGTLRWKGRLDQIIDSLSVSKKPSGWLRKILLMAAYQIIVQDRVHAGLVVSESVTLIRERDGKAPSQFANACLRKVSEYADRLRTQECPKGHKAAAEWACMPEWLWIKIVKQHGDPWAKEFAAATLERPVTWLRTRDPQWTPLFDAERFANSSNRTENTLSTQASGRSGRQNDPKVHPDLGPRAEPTLYPSPDFRSQPGMNCAWKWTEGGRVDLLPGFKEGQFIVQDISSQTLVEEMFACVQELRSGVAGTPAPESTGSSSQTASSFKSGFPGAPIAPRDPAIASGSRVDQPVRPLRVLDLCAAPGGKSVALAWLGAEVVSTDFNEKRALLLQSTVTRAAPQIQVVPWKNLQDATDPKKLDWIFIDAPCSGTGIIRRHPDVKWLRTEKDIASLAATQTKLLEDAWAKIPDGGFVSYSVCSVLKDEGPGVIERSGLAKFVVKEWALAPHVAPHGDGFWGVLLRK